MTPALARRAQLAACLLLALATLIGAFGAHALKARLDPDRYAVLQTAVQYQFFHALGLLILGTLALQAPLRALNAAMLTLFTGILLFSGSLYMLLGGAPRWLGILTPLGGLCLIAGWLLTAWSLWRNRRAPAA